jgi:rhamnosyl/mannosyltransferase
LRILQVGKYYAPIRGGIENLVHALSRGLARQHEVTALVFNRGRETVQETMEGVRIIRVGSLGLVQSVEIAPAFLRWIAKVPTDMITVHMPNPLGELATWLSRPAVGVVLMYHSDIVRQRALKFLYSPFLNAILRRADRIVVTSRRYMESSETLGPFKTKCAVIPLGLDLDDYAVTPEVDARAAELRREHGEEMVLFVGRLVYYKGVDILLRSAPGFRGKIVVAGEGPLREKLAAMVGEMGIEDRVTLLGNVPHLEKLALYRACKVAVLPATHRSEAFGLVQVEAHACGRPVVSTDLDSGVPFVNQDGVSGLIVPPSDPVALGAAIGRLLTDQELRGRLGDQARRRALEEFSLERMMRDMVALYDEVRRERQG